MQPNGTRINSTITLAGNPAWKSCRDRPSSVWRSSQENRGLSSAKEPAPRELSVNTINILKTAWVWCLNQPPSSLLPQHKKAILFRFFEGGIWIIILAPPSLLPAKFQWLMVAILWNFEMWGLEGRGQRNTMDSKEAGGGGAEALGTLEHVRAGKWFIEVMMINICLWADMCILPNDLKRPQWRKAGNQSYKQA